MEVTIFKLIYTKKISKQFKNTIKYLNQEIKDQIKNNNIKILDKNFVKNNSNKAKLIINNKKCNLIESINGGYKENKIKINIIFSKELIHFSFMFENCIQLKEILIYNNVINYDKNLENDDMISDYNGTINNEYDEYYCKMIIIRFLIKIIKIFLFNFEIILI